MKDIIEKTGSRTARLGLRATVKQHALIRNAAAATNKSVTEFILDSVCTAAENALIDQCLFFLDNDGWNRFQEMLDRPARIDPKLQDLLKEKPPWE